MIGQTVEIGDVVYVYTVTRDHGTTNYVRTYEVAAFSRDGNRLNFVVEAKTPEGARVNVGTINIPLPDTQEEKQRLADALSRLVLTDEVA